MQRVENFPKSLYQQYEILDSILGWAALNIAVAMKKLAEQGVLLLKGTLEGEKKAKLFLNYKGVNLAEGNPLKIKSDIEFLAKKSQDEITNFLDDAFEQYAKRVIKGNFEILPHNLLQKNIRDAVARAKSK